MKNFKSICIGLVALIATGWLSAPGLAENSEKNGTGYPVLDWQYFGSGGGGCYSFVAAAPSQPNRVYCGVDVGGIYRSDDGGFHWYPIYAGLRYTGGNPAGRVYTSASIAISYQNPDVFYIWTTFGGLWKTTDGGFSYERIGKQEIKGEQLNMPQMVAINPKSDQECIVFAMGHFNRTMDGGKTFQIIPNPGDADKKISAAAVFYPDKGDEPILWMGDETFHRSVDGGKTWQKCSMNGWPGGSGQAWNNYLGRVLWSSRTSANGKPVLLMLSEKDKGELYRSSDLGETWQKAPTLMEENQPYYGREKLFPQSALWVDPDDADHFGLTSWPQETGHVTQDGGKTWVHSTLCPDQPGRYIESGGTTNIQNDGYAFVSGKKERVFVCTQFSLFRSDDGGKSFYCLEHRRLGKHHYQSTGTDAQYVGAIVVDPCNGFRYIQDDDVGIARSEDFGRTFHLLRYIVEEDKESDSGFAGKETWNGHTGCNIIVDGGYQPSRLYTWFSPMVPLPHEYESVDMKRVYTTRRNNRRGLYFSDDQGRNFHWRSSYKSCPWAWVPLPQSLVMDQNSPKDARLFYITVAGGVFSSSDGGHAWQCLNDAIAKSLNLSLPDPYDCEPWRERESFFARVRIDPKDSKILYVSTIHRNVKANPSTRLPALLKSVDKGQTWQALESPIISCWAFEISPFNHEWLYAADGKSGVYFSKDGGKTWVKRLDLDYVTCIVPSRRDRSLVYVASNASNRSNVKAGIFRTKDDGGTWQDITGQLPHLCVMTMTEDPLDPHWLYVGTRGGGSFMAYDFLPISKE